MSKWVKWDEQMGKQNEQMGKQKMLKYVNMKLSRKNYIKKVWNVYQWMVNCQKNELAPVYGPINVLSPPVEKIQQTLWESNDFDVIHLSKGII